MRAKGGKSALIRRRQKSTLIFSANVNEAEGTQPTAFAGGLDAVQQLRSWLNLTVTVPE